jgi:hypothetical protein
MAEVRQYVFTYEEIVETLIKKQGIHEGLWGIYVRFGLAAGNVGEAATGNFLPAAIIPVHEIGIQRFDQPSNLTVDAAVVNPAPSATKARARQKSK